MINYNNHEWAAPVEDLKSGMVDARQTGGVLPLSS